MGRTAKFFFWNRAKEPLGENAPTVQIDDVEKFLKYNNIHWADNILFPNSKSTI
jgi:hypothetical protein